MAAEMPFDSKRCGAVVLCVCGSSGAAGLI